MAGTGLGIAHKIVKELGSKIEFTSAEGWGSAFWFALNITISNEMVSFEQLPAVWEVVENEERNYFTFEGNVDKIFF